MIVEIVPAVTEPPGELIYNDIALSGASASRNSSWATMVAEVASSTCPFRHIIRSWIAVSWYSDHGPSFSYDSREDSGDRSIQHCQEFIALGQQSNASY